MKVGVFDMGGSGWTGGITYLRNLGYAVKTTIPEQLSLFLVRKVEPNRSQEDWVSAYFDGVIEVAPFGGSHRPALELFRQGVSLLAGGDIINARRFEKAVARHGIDALFGLGLTNKFKLPAVGWFGDFQHVDLPEFFSRRDLLIRDLQLKRMVRNCKLLVFSSQHAKKRFLQIYPARANMARVLNFTAHLPAQALTSDPGYVVQKLRIPEKFIYLPNQLWMHKNHLTAFRAVKILADSNQRICLVCSGNLSTNPLNPGYKDEVFKYIKENNLSDRIFILGLVDFADVYALIRQCCCVLNPSLYEGWSTTVEETKTLGKPMILSDLEVHREQAPPKTVFFEPKNAEMLAKALAEIWRLYPAGPNRPMEEAAGLDYPGRSKRFAQTFADICREAAKHDGGGS
jgi:glycosyltransferase involved in cell wall biosynthesis